MSCSPELVWTLWPIMGLEPQWFRCPICSLYSCLYTNYDVLAVTLICDINNLNTEIRILQWMTLELLLTQPYSLSVEKRLEIYMVLHSLLEVSCNLSSLASQKISHIQYPLLCKIPNSFTCWKHDSHYHFQILFPALIKCKSTDTNVTI